jgi:hypothetical protein
MTREQSDKDDPNARARSPGDAQGKPARENAASEANEEPVQQHLEKPRRRSRGRVSDSSTPRPNPQ